MNSENHIDNGGKSIRLFRPSIVVLCGPAGCGKSTFAKRHFRPTQIISSDWARALICDDERDQRFNTQAFELLRFLVERRLTVNRLCVVDSTALTGQARKDLLDLARKCQVPATLVLFNSPLEACIERDAKRERSVGKAIIERQYQAMEGAQGTIWQEGFDQVVELQDSDLEKVQIEILLRPIARPLRPEVGAARQFDRPARPSWRRPSGPRDTAQSASSPQRPQPPASPRPATPSAPPATPKEAAPRSGEGHAPIATKQSTPSANNQAPRPNPPKVSLPAPPTAPPNPAPTAAPRQVSVEAKSSDKS